MRCIDRLRSHIRAHKHLRSILREAKMYFVRKYYSLDHVHRTFYLGGKADIASDFRAGAYSFVGRGCCICPKVSIGAYTYLAHDVTILGGDHNYNVPGVPICYSGRPEMPETIIDEDVWVGHRAIIKAGVRINRGAIVAAGAVVTKDVPAYEIFGGVPAVKIADRFIHKKDVEIHEEMLNLPPFKGVLPTQRVFGVTGN